MAEDAFWQSLRPHLYGLDPVRIENVLTAGTPDVNYRDGWIELKDRPAWPKDAEGLVSLPTLEDRKEQMVFLARRWKSGGLCWLFVRVGVSKLLFDGWTAHTIRTAQLLYGGMPRPEFEATAVWGSHTMGLTRTDRERLQVWLTGDVEQMHPHERAKFFRLKVCRTPQDIADDMKVDVADVLRGEHSDGIEADNLLAYWEA